MAKEFRVGDVCRVRDWGDMLAEFGVDSTGRINTFFFRFISEMKHLCGKIFTIKEVDNSWGSITTYLSEEGVENHESGHTWMITADMLEPFAVTQESDIDLDFDLILSDLLGY